jgi:AAA+ ATPase superfamily predicted ATPase
MDRFVGRQSELGSLREIADRADAQFLLVYGRRRVGKTTLLLKWAEEVGLPLIYWVAARDSAANVRLGVTRAVWTWAYPGSQSVPRFDTWAQVFEAIANLIGDQRVILILDEFAYAVESDSSLPSYLQAAWDHQFKQSNVILVLSGSHIRMMVNLLGYQAPLYGRFTAHLHLKPLPFAATTAFFPRYTAVERVAVYAILGGVPAYLERFDDAESIGRNVRQEVMSPTGILRIEPFFLLADEVREPRNYAAVLRAIGEGHHTLDAITLAAGLTKQHVSSYLSRLRELHLVERRVPATAPPIRAGRSHRGLYHLRDHYHRFYFRFLDPHRHLLEQGQTDFVWQQIQAQMLAFVGATAFEELCRAWVWQQVTARRFPFLPQDVGAHWGKGVQVDVVAISWQDKAILLGEAEWSTGPVGGAVIRQLIEGKTPKVLAALPHRGEEWAIHFAFFARAGFTEAAQAEAKRHGAMLVDLATLDHDLGCYVKST